MATDVQQETAATVSDDAFLGGRLQILQSKSGYRAGLDAVMLAAAVPAMPGEAVLEAGIGAGAATLCLAARVGGLSITGVEIDAACGQLRARHEREQAAS